MFIILLQVSCPGTFAHNPGILVLELAGQYHLGNLTFMDTGDFILVQVGIMGRQTQDMEYLFRS